MMIHELFSEVWAELEGTRSEPNFVRDIHIIDFKEMSERVHRADKGFVRKILSSLFQGDAFILKNAIGPDKVKNIKEQTKEFWGLEPSSFHQMKEGCPNFHRKIGKQESSKYYANPIKHSTYFFRWNENNIPIFDEFEESTDLMKIIAGLDPKIYMSNTPKDGCVDRAQVVFYPKGGGKIDSHSDPVFAQKVSSIVYMSKRGQDYQDGGYYMINSDFEFVDVESMIDSGDLGFIYPTVGHGVLPVDKSEMADSKEFEGRWCVGIFSIVSDEAKARKTGNNFSPDKLPVNPLVVKGQASLSFIKVDE